MCQCQELASAHKTPASLGWRDEAKVSGFSQIWSCSCLHQVIGLSWKGLSGREQRSLQSKKVPSFLLMLGQDDRSFEALHHLLPWCQLRTMKSWNHPGSRKPDVLSSLHSTPPPPGSRSPQWLNKDLEASAPCLPELTESPPINSQNAAGTGRPSYVQHSNPKLDP